MVALQHFVVLALSAVALAAPSPTSESSGLVKRDVRDIRGETCGNNKYTENDVRAAAEAAANHIAKGTHAGKSTYPKEYRNNLGKLLSPEYQLPIPVNAWAPGLPFPCGSYPLYWFPIFKDHVYTGGTQGPDFLVFGPNPQRGYTQFCGLITHTDAGGNGKGLKRCT